MNRLNEWRFALAAAVAFAVLDAICALAVILSPGGTLAIFNTWFHGLDLNLLVPPGGRPVTPGRFIEGVISAAVVSFMGGAVLASCYNLLGRTRQK